MAQSTSQHRKLAIAGVALAAIAIVCIIWTKRPAAQLKGSSDDLIERLIAARPDQRDDLMIELGNRGAQVIPQVTAAWEKASKDPDLRSQLATIIFRTGAPAEAVPALKRLLQNENDPGVRSTIESYLAGLQRS